MTPADVMNNLPRKESKTEMYNIPIQVMKEEVLSILEDLEHSSRQTSA
jgi:hypothetical protein